MVAATTNTSEPILLHPGFLHPGSLKTFYPFTTLSIHAWTLTIHDLLPSICIITVSFLHAITDSSHCRRRIIALYVIH
jgi:hypothetical protein